MSLESIQSFCSKENFAGNTHIECVPVQWIKYYPEFATDGHNFAQAIDLILGKAWLVFPCVPETLDFRERERSGKHGPLDTPTISGFVPGDTPKIASVLNSSKANEWVVILYYKTGEAKVIGSPDYPARFSSSLTNRGSLNSGKGYDIEFYSEGDFKTFFLEEPPGSEDVGCLPGVVVIKDSNGVDIDTVVAPSGEIVPYAVADSIIDIEGLVWNVPATDNLNLIVVDTLGNNVAVSKNGEDVVVNDLPICEEWVRPCWWATEPEIGDNEILMLMIHDTDEPTEMVVPIFNAPPANSIELFYNGISKGLFTTPETLITIDPATDSFIENGRKWTWIKFKIISTVTSGSASIDLWRADSSLVKGFNRSLPILEMIQNTFIDTANSIRQAVGVNSQSSGAVYDLKRLVHFKVINGTDISLRNLNIEHLTVINSQPILNLYGAFDGTYSLKGEYKITGSIRAFFMNSKGSHDVKFHSEDVVWLYETFTNNSNAIRFEFTDLSNVSSDYAGFENCYNLKTLILPNLKYYLDIRNCYSLSEQSLLDMLNSMGDLTGYPTNSIQMLGITVYPSVISLAAAKNWTLLNY